MTKNPFKKNYLPLDDVRVFYDKKTDNIYLTSKDKNIPKDSKGFKINLTAGRESELTLRTMLRNAGIIDPEHLTPKDLPTQAKYPGSENHAWNEIPLGVQRNSETVWDVSVAPHALIVGSAGQGKSVIQRNIIFHCLQNSDKWRFLGIDLKQIELAPYVKYDDVVMAIANSVEDGAETLRYANEEMKNRYDEMKDSKVNHFTDLTNHPHALMIMIDDAYTFLAKTGIKTDEGKRQDAIKSEASALIGDIARLGRAAGVHLVMATQRPDATVIYGELKQNLGMRIVAGRADIIASQMTLDNDHATYLPGNVRGRGYVQTFGKGEPFQGYFAEQNWFDEWKKRND